MKNQSKYLPLSAVITSIVCSIVVAQTQAIAQYRGQDSQQFFERGNEIIEEQIKKLQEENKPTTEKKDEPTLVTEESEFQEKIEPSFEIEQIKPEKMN